MPIRVHTVSIFVLLNLAVLLGTQKNSRNKGHINIKGFIVITGNEQLKTAKTETLQQIGIFGTFFAEDAVDCCKWRKVIKEVR